VEALDLLSRALALMLKQRNFSHPRLGVFIRSTQTQNAEAARNASQIWICNPRFPVLHEKGFWAENSLTLAAVTLLLQC